MIDIEVVKSLMEKRRGHWPTIADDTGISYSWLTKFMAGKFSNPGYRRIELLHKYLVSSRQSSSG